MNVTPINHMTPIKQEMSNYDLTIDDGMDEELRNNPNQKYGVHSAWYFNGLVFFNGTKFVEIVYQYHEVVDEIEADSLRELMDAVNEIYGSD